MREITKCCCTEKSRLWEAGYVARLEKAMHAYRIFVGETSWKMENQK
jgi:hypothetical protein